MRSISRSQAYGLRSHVLCFVRNLLDFGFVALDSMLDGINFGFQRGGLAFEFLCFEPMEVGFVIDICGGNGAKACLKLG